MLWPFRVLHIAALNAAWSGLSFSTLFLPFIFFCCFCGWQPSTVCEGHQFGRCLPFKHQVVEAGCQGGARLKEAGVPMQRRARETGRYRARKSARASILWKLLGTVNHLFCFNYWAPFTHPTISPCADFHSQKHSFKVPYCQL